MNTAKISEILRRGGVKEDEVYAILTAIVALADAHESTDVVLLEKYGTLAPSICAGLLPPKT